MPSADKMTDFNFREACDFMIQGMGLDLAWLFNIIYLLVSICIMLAQVLKQF